MLLQVNQHVSVCEPYDKMRKMYEILEKTVRNGKCLIFTSTKRDVDELCRSLCRDRYRATAIHGTTPNLLMRALHLIQFLRACQSHSLCV